MNVKYSGAIQAIDKSPKRSPPQPRIIQGIVAAATRSGPVPRNRVALKEIERLWDAPPRSADHDRLEVLEELVPKLRHHAARRAEDARDRS